MTLVHKLPLVRVRFGDLEEVIRADIDADGHPDAVVIFRGENAFYKMGRCIPYLLFSTSARD